MVLIVHNFEKCHHKCTTKQIRCAQFSSEVALSYNSRTLEGTATFMEKGPIKNSGRRHKQNATKHSLIFEIKLPFDPYTVPFIHICAGLLDTYAS